MPSEIKKSPLLFDLGGVIIDIRRTNCEAAFRRLGFSDISQFLGDYGQKGPFLQIEEGEITPDQFRAQLRRHLPAGVTDAQIDAAFNAFITGIPVSRLRSLRALRAEGHPLYVISNTNPIMWDGPIKAAFEQEGLTIGDYFDGVVTSFEAHCCKPDPAIFQKVIADFGIDPAETIFFDDSEANCRIASTLGFRALHVPPGTEFITLLHPAR